jgi:hypothetical protein
MRVNHGSFSHLWGVMWESVAERVLRFRKAPCRRLLCAPGRNRTYDRQIRRLLLYPLSYRGQDERP